VATPVSASLEGPGPPGSGATPTPPRSRAAHPLKQASQLRLARGHPSTRRGAPRRPARQRHLMPAPSGRRRSQRAISPHAAPLTPQSSLFYLLRSLCVLTATVRTHAALRKALCRLAGVIPHHYSTCSRPSPPVQPSNGREEPSNEYMSSDRARTPVRRGPVMTNAGSNPPTLGHSPVNRARRALWSTATAMPTPVPPTLVLPHLPRPRINQRRVAGRGLRRRHPSKPLQDKHRDGRDTRRSRSSP
jgi:hypothetical protein